MDQELASWVCLEFKSTDYQEMRNREDKQPRMRKDELAEAGPALGKHSVLERNALPVAAAGLEAWHAAPRAATAISTTIGRRVKKTAVRTLLGDCRNIASQQAGWRLALSPQKFS